MRNHHLKGIFLITFFISFAFGAIAQDGFLKFDSKGKLINEYPQTATNIKGFIITQSVKEYDKAKAIINTNVKNVYEQLQDTFSFFRGIVDSLYPTDKFKVKHIFDKDSSINFQPTDTDSAFEKNKFPLFPNGFEAYYKFLNEITKDASKMDENKYQPIIPFTVIVGKNKKKLVCDNIEVNNGVINFTFCLNESLYAKNEESLPYTITKKNILQQLTNNYFNSLYSTKDSSIRVLNLIDGYFKKEVSKNISDINKVVDSIALLQEFPANTNLRKEQDPIVWGRYIDLKQQLINQIGYIDSNKTIFQQSKILQKWIVQWAWLTGGNGIINPYKFTSEENIATSNMKEDSLLLKDIFYTRILDSLKTFEDISKMEQLVTNKQRVLKNQRTIAGSKKAVENNDIAIAKISTTETTINSGTLFYDKNEATTLRNYYFDADVTSNKNKFKFKYPEEDKVIVLYHNVPVGTHMQIQGNYKPFDDTPDFTKFVSKAIDTLGGLFSLVNAGLGGYQKLLKTFEIKMKNPPSQDGVKEMKTKLIDTETRRETQTVITEESSPEIIYDHNAKKYENAAADSLGAMASDANSAYKFNKKSRIIKKVNTIFRTISVLKENIEKVLCYYYSQSKSNEQKSIIDSFANIKTKFKSSNKFKNALFKKLESIKLNNIGNIEVKITPRERQFYKALNIMQNDKLLPNADFTIEENTDTVPNYKSQAFMPDAKEAPYTFEYSLTKIIKDAKAPNGYQKFKTDSSYYNVGKRYRFQLAAGLAYSLAPIFQTRVDTSGNSFSINKDENRARLIVGLRLYLGKGIYNLDNKFIPKGSWNFLNKTSIMIGVGIPKPLDNYYIGLGYDIVPGLNVNSGVHGYRYVNYELANNSIVGNTAKLKLNGFVAITLDPSLFVKILKTL